MSQRSEEVLDEEFQHEIEGVVAPTPRGSKEMISCLDVNVAAKYMVCKEKVEWLT